MLLMVTNWAGYWNRFGPGGTQEALTFPVLQFNSGGDVFIRKSAMDRIQYWVYAIRKYNGI